MPSSIPARKPVAERPQASMRGGSSAKRQGTGIRAAILSLLCAAAGVSAAHATTISWGSEIVSDFRTSDGMPLADTFVAENFSIQLGFFANSFVPTAANASSWDSQWRVFDQADVNLGLNVDDRPVYDYFASQAELSALGTSDSTFAARNPDGTGVYDFRGQMAYIWIRNSANPVPGTEWFLATAGEAWRFPLVGVDECCDPALDLQWSVSQLNPGAAPVFGGQNGQIGAGDYTDPNPTNPYTLQTYTFLVPEPSSLLLTLTGSCLLLIRRRPAA